MILLGWSDAAFGTHGQDGRCRLGYKIGVMSSTLTGPAHIPQWASKFPPKPIKSSLVGAIFALREMGYRWYNLRPQMLPGWWDHMEMIREFYIALGHEKIRSYELIDCECLLSHLRTGRFGTEELLTRHFHSILDAQECKALGNVPWIPGAENPADGLTKAKSALEPLSHVLDLARIDPDVRDSCAV